jgi:hypothetical protein
MPSKSLGEGGKDPPSSFFCFSRTFLLTVSRHAWVRWGSSGAGHGYLTIFSADSELSLNTSSEAPESLCKGLRGDSNGGYW